MRLLIDTNVILDVLLKRRPFFCDAAGVLKLAAQQGISEFVSASAVTDIYYIIRKMFQSKETARDLLRKLLTVVSIAAVSEREILEALESDWNDFEDSVQYAVAKLSNMDVIITRNKGDYKESQIPVWTPKEALNNIKSYKDHNN